MGVVLKARDKKLKRDVAIKVLAPQMAAHPESVQRFLREAQSAAAVRHENVVTIYSVDDNPQSPFIVMEYIAGESLQERIAREGPLPPHDVAEIGRQIALGLAAAHAQGLMHRDIKPGNVLLEEGIRGQGLGAGVQNSGLPDAQSPTTNPYRVKLTDFGLARAVDDIGLSHTGTIAGTPQFMSPEQADGLDVDHRTDLFSLGSVLYTMCVGRPPFEAHNTVATLRRIVNAEPAPIAEERQQPPEGLWRIIHKLLAKNPDNRFQTATEVAELLGQCLQPGARDPGLAKPRRRAISVATAILVLLAGGFVAAQLTGYINRVRTPEQDIASSAALSNSQTSEMKELPTADAPPFVIVAKDNRAKSRHASLAAAVEVASSGDTIEIRGNGPLVTDSIDLANKSLVIRAGAGFHPLLQASAGALANDWLLKTQSALTLEGLDIQQLHDTAWREGMPSRDIIVSEGGDLRAANCRFVGLNLNNMIYAKHGGALKLQNCLFIGDIGVAATIYPTRGPVHFDNCIQVVRTAACWVQLPGRHSTETLVELTRNTFVDGGTLFINPTRPSQDQGERGGTIRVQARSNVLASPIMFHMRIFEGWLKEHGPLSVADTETMAQSLMRWEGDRNLYDADTTCLLKGPDLDRRVVKQLADWQAWWGDDDANRLEGNVRFQVGDWRTKKLSDLTAADFRLAPGSPGKGGDPTGKDLGADVEFVGPGQPYEKWRETKEYDEWRKHSPGATPARLASQDKNTIAFDTTSNEKALSNPIVSADYTWSEPVNLGPGVNSSINDDSACISSDGLTLIFNRLVKGKLRLWESRRANISETFGSATLLPDEVNGPRSDNDTPFLSRDGLTLWFSSSRPVGYGQRDLWMSRRQSLTAAWEPPINLGPNVNTTGFEQSPFVTNDGRTLFFSRNVSDQFQILQATRTNETEPFGDARILTHVNNGECSSLPRVTEDGLVLVFVHSPDRLAPLGLWLATRRSVDEEFGAPTNLGSTINDSVVSGPSLSADGLTLYYASQRPGGHGGSDLWMIRRAKKPAAAHASPQSAKD